MKLGGVPNFILDPLAGAFMGASTAAIYAKPDQRWQAAEMGGAVGGLAGAIGPHLARRVGLFNTPNTAPLPSIGLGIGAGLINANIDRSIQRPAAKTASALRSPLVQRALMGGTAGGVAGYYLSPEDRKGLGTMAGIGLAGAGAAMGPRALDLLHDKVKDPSAMTPGMQNSVGGALGALAGIGATQLFTGKNKADSSEDPYYYTHR